MDLSDRNRWMQPESDEPTEGVEFWFKYDPNTDNFALLFTSPSNRQQVKIHLTSKLMERFMDESLAFFIDIMNREEREEDENSP